MTNKEKCELCSIEGTCLCKPLNSLTEPSEIELELGLVEKTLDPAPALVKPSQGGSAGKPDPDSEGLASTRPVGPAEKVVQDGKLVDSKKGAPAKSGIGHVSQATDKQLDQEDVIDAQIDAMNGSQRVAYPGTHQETIEEQTEIALANAALDADLDAKRVKTDSPKDNLTQVAEGLEESAEVIEHSAGAGHWDTKYNLVRESKSAAARKYIPVHRQR